MREEGAQRDAAEDHGDLPGTVCLKIIESVFFVIDLGSVLVLKRSFN